MTRRGARPFPIAAAWLCLVVAACLGVATTGAWLPARAMASAAVLLMVAKIWLIVARYMDVRGSTWPLAPILAGWTVAVSLLRLVDCWG